MAIIAESTSNKIILTISDDPKKNYILQRASIEDRTWLTLTENGFELLPESADSETVENPTENGTDENENIPGIENGTENNETIEEIPEENGQTDSKVIEEGAENEPTLLSDTEIEKNTDIIEENNETVVKLVKSGDLIDSYNLTDGLYEYRYVDSAIKEPKGEDYVYSKWVKFGVAKSIGYSFGNYSAPAGKWGTAVTPDDCRYTFLWGTDFKATNGSYFTDEQIQWFIDEATKYIERELNITIKKRVIKCSDETDDLVKTTKYKEGDYDDEESYYDFSYRKIQRYGMINTQQRPIIKVTRLDLIKRGNSKESLLNSVVLDKKKGLIKFINRPWRSSETYRGINTAISMYGDESFNSNMFYAIDYEAGYKNSDEIPEDLRQIIGKVAAVSLLNIIGDGLMSGFSSSSLSMDGISESFSSTQSATSAYFGARIQVYKDDIKNYIQENKYKFGFIPIGAL